VTSFRQKHKLISKTFPDSIFIRYELIAKYLEDSSNGNGSSRLLPHGQTEKFRA
jgi:hypothetical protein